MVDRIISGDAEKLNERKRRYRNENSICFSAGFH